MTTMPSMFLQQQEIEQPEPYDGVKKIHAFSTPLPSLLGELSGAQAFGLHLGVVHDMLAHSTSMPAHRAP